MTSRQRRRAVRSPRRAKSVFALVVLFLGVQVYQVYHLEAVQHRYCGVHEQLEHVACASETACPGASSGASSEVVPSQAPVLATRGAKHAPEHDEACFLEQVLRDPIASLGALSRPSTSTIALASAVPVGAQERHEPVSRLRLAPKQSPPV